MFNKSESTEEAKIHPLLAKAKKIFHNLVVAVVFRRYSSNDNGKTIYTLLHKTFYSPCILWILAT